ncbi:MAG: c-type cytochrome [Bacteriovoracaceae bacterium]|nr:c-type cytochrome [Bacteriovoracaceae bacterium]
MKLIKILIPLFMFFTSNYATAAELSGAEIFMNTCSKCHDPSVNFGDVPVLFGQEAVYIKRSLQAFKSGSRTDHILKMMNGIASKLSDKEIENVSTFLASSNPCDFDLKIDYKRADFKKEFREGKALVQKNSCMHCHGTFHHFAPKLYGQKLSYLKKTMAAFKTKTRVAPIMNRFAAALSDEDIEKMLTYFNAMALMRSCE